MQLADVRRDALADGRFELSGNVEFADGVSSRVWFRVPDAFGAPDLDDASPFVPAVLPLCMRRGERLEVHAPVSARMLGSLEKAQEVLWSFWPKLLRPVAVSAPAQALAAGPPATVSLFTRGLDSWYTVLTADDDRGDRPPLSHLVFVPSADIWDAGRAERDRRRVAAAAEMAGFPLLACETNLRELAEPILGWDEYHGAFLAACGLALGASHMLIPSTGADGELMANGSHPLLDPLWSTERTEILNHGDAVRIAKARTVAESPAALATVRTCWREEGNCGRCGKCLHTMVELELAGALRDCATFPDTADPSVIARAMPSVNPVGSRLWELVASQLADDADGRAKRLAIDVIVWHQRVRALASDCEAFQQRLSDREAVARAVPGLDAELRAACEQGRGLATRLGDTLIHHAR